MPEWDFGGLPRKKGWEPTEPTTPAAAPSRAGLSPEGVDAIKQREGFRAEPYWDFKGYSVGYGQQRWKGQPVTPDMRVTKEEADAEFDRQVTEEYAPIVSNALKVPVTQHQYESLVSMAYNLPAAAQAVIEKLNRGETPTAEDFQSHTSAGGKPNASLKARRQSEYEQFFMPGTSERAPTKKKSELERRYGPQWSLPEPEDLDPTAFDFSDLPRVEAPKPGTMPPPDTYVNRVREAVGYPAPPAPVRPTDIPLRPEQKPHAEGVTQPESVSVRPSAPSITPPTVRPGAPHVESLPGPAGSTRVTSGDIELRTKGEGFLGPLKRRDGKGGVSSEISIGVNLDGREVEIPTLVPTLSAAERQWLLTNDISDPTKIPQAIVDKAEAHARERLKAGKSPFAQPGETGDEEERFQRWYANIVAKLGERGQTLNPDPDDPEHHYDYRAAFRAGIEPQRGPDGTFHWESTAKDQTHPNRIVGGFDTATGRREPGTPRAKDAAELESLGWSHETAARLALTPEPEAPKPFSFTATGISAAPTGPIASALGWMPKARSLRDWVRDAMTTYGKGVVGAVEGVVGLADVLTTPSRLAGEAITGKKIPTPGEVLEWIGYDPRAQQAWLDTYYSDQQKRANATVEEAEGLLNKTVEVLKNPTWIAQKIGESLPSMAVGGVLGRGVGAAGWLAGAIGEGAMTTGQGAEQTRQETGTLTGLQALLATSAGVVTGGLGMAGGKLADVLGIADPDTLLAAGMKDAVVRRNILSTLFLGGLAEGVLEEMPQSAQEQIHQNWATGKPWYEGVAEQAILGGFVGFFMGAGAQVPSAVAARRTPEAERLFRGSAAEIDAFNESTKPPPRAGPPPILEPSGPPPPPPVAPKPTGAPTGPSIVITRFMRDALHALGYDDAAIQKLSPEDARAAIEEKRAPSEQVGPPPPPPGQQPPPEPTPGPPPGPPPPGAPPTAAPTQIDERVRGVLRARGVPDEVIARLSPQEAMALIRQQLPGQQPPGPPPMPPPGPPGGPPVAPPEPPPPVVPPPVPPPPIAATPPPPVAPEPPPAVPREPWQMTRREFADDPRAIRVPKGSVLALSPEQLAAGETLTERSKGDLQAILQVLDAPLSGNKHELVERIKTRMAARNEVRGATLEELRAKPKAALLDLVERLGGGRPTYLNRFALSAAIINRRNQARQRGTSALADARHRQLVQRALESGVPVPEQVLRDYPDLLPGAAPAAEPPRPHVSEDVAAALRAAGHPEAAIAQMTPEEAEYALAAPPEPDEEAAPAPPAAAPTEKPIEQMTEDELAAMAARLFGQYQQEQEAASATEVGQQPERGEPEHPGTAPVGAAPEAVGRDRAVERPEVVEGGRAEPAEGEAEEAPAPEKPVAPEPKAIRQWGPFPGTNSPGALVENLLQVGQPVRVKGQQGVIAGLATKPAYLVRVKFDNGETQGYGPHVVEVGWDEDGQIVTDPDAQVTPGAQGLTATTLSGGTTVSRPTPRTYDRDKAQTTFRNFKTALTKVVNAAQAAVQQKMPPPAQAERWKAVAREAERFKAYYESSPEPWPDDHHRWERAGDDARYALRRLEPTAIGRPLTVPEPTTPEAAPEPPDIGTRVKADEGVGEVARVSESGENVKIALEPDGRLSLWIPTTRVTPVAAEAAAPTEAPAPPAEREKRPDGRLRPREGDKVYQRVAGFGGSAAVINGEVYRKGPDLRVRVTGSASLLGSGGGPAKGKTYKLDGAWTVVGDPEIARRAAVREAEEKANKEEIERENKAYQERGRQAAQDEIDAGRAPLTKATAVGSRVFNHWQDRWARVDEQTEYGPVLRNETEKTDYTIGNANALGVWEGYSVEDKATAPPYEPPAPPPPGPVTTYDDALAALRQTGVAQGPGGLKVRVVPRSDGNYELEITEKGQRRFEGNLSLDDAPEYGATILETLAAAQAAKAPTAQAPAPPPPVPDPHPDPAAGFADLQNDPELQALINDLKSDVAKDKPQFSRADAAPPVTGAVHYNPKFHSIEVAFPKDPGPQVRANLSGAGFVFSGQQKRWYRRIAEKAKTDSVIEAAKAEANNLIGTGPSDEPQFSRAKTRPDIRQPHPTDRRMEELLGKFGGGLDQAYRALPRMQVPGVSGLVPIYDAGERLTTDERVEMFQNPAVQRLVASIHETTRHVAAQLLGPKSSQIADVGVVLDQQLDGVNWPQAAAPEGRPRRSGVLINTFEPISRAHTAANGSILPPARTPQEAAERVFETIVHEVIHEEVAGHGGDFKEALANALARFEDNGLGARYTQALANSYGDTDRGTFHPDITQAISLYSESRRRRSTAPSVLGVAGGYEPRPADEQPGQAGVGGRAGPAGEGTPPAIPVTQDRVLKSLKILQVLKKRGLTEFPTVVRAFQAIYGPDGRSLDRVLEMAWQAFTGETVSVAQALQPAQTTTEEIPSGTTGRGAVPTGEEAPAEPDGRRGDGTARPGDEHGVQPGVSERPELGSGEGTDAGGTVPAETGGRGEPGPAPESDAGRRDPALTPPLYRITPADEIGSGTDREKIARNFAAIQVLKTLQAEGRPATLEEQQLLVKYVGWGGLKRIFEPWKYEEERAENKYWQEQHKALRELLTEEEYARARNSTQNAHYTSEPVIRGMWDAVRRLGVRSGSALEPSTGIGHFVGLAPDDLRGLSWAMVDKDTISADIAKALYTGAYVQAAGFEDAKLPREHFTLAISNVPFGLIPITDKLVPAFLRARIHNYFFAKALDMVMPGGLVAFISTRGTLDSRDNTAVRNYLAARADFLGAVRLPRTAFEKNAGTSVVTDIIYLRKRVEGAAPAHVAPWVETTEVKLPNETGELVTQHVNEYMLAHPEMVLGVQTSTGQMRAEDQYNVEPTGWTVENQKPPVPDIAAQLAAAHAHLPAGAIDTLAVTQSLDTFQHEQPPLGTRPFEFLEHEGKLAQVVDGKVTAVLQNTPADKARANRVRGILPIRSAVRSVYDLLAAQADTDEVKAAQAVLTKAYDAFVKKYGFLSTRDNVQAFNEDPDAPLMLSLESWDEELETAVKTDIFSQETSGEFRRALTADTPSQALHIALGETGRVDLGRAGELLKISADEAAVKLESEGLIIYTPTGGWELASKYLAGNVREKLVEAEAALQLDHRFQHAVDRLKAVIPEDVPSHKISVKLGAPWVPVEMVRQFLSDLVGRNIGQHWTVRWVESDAQWMVDGPPGSYTNPNYSTANFSFKDLLLATMNDRKITVRVGDPPVIDPVQTTLARQRKEDLHRAFGEWLFNADPARRQWAVRHFNDSYNATVDIKVDGSYLEFPGMSAYWRDKMDAHQRDAVARILQFGNTLLAHVVGAGKTLTMIAAGMEMRRLGMARKPLYVVPNHLVEQWAGDFTKHYPKAKVLVARPEDLAKENRKRFTARVAAGNFDAVIMPVSSFSRISISPEAETAFHTEQLEEIEQAILEEWHALGEKPQEPGGRRRLPPSVARLENMRDKIQRDLDKLADRPTDDLLTFEQLGVDALFADESHLFKNLYFHTRQEAVGIPRPQKTQRAVDMYLKVRHINRVSNYRNVVFASGTPVANSMAEIYTVQRMLQENVLERLGIKQFDAWLRQFGVISMQNGVNPSGTGFATRRTLEDFQNLAQLSQMFRQFTDVKLIDDLPKLKAARPPLQGDAPEVVEVPAGEMQLDYLGLLDHRASNLDPRDRRRDNMAKINMDGRVAMLDVRMLNRTLPEQPGNKISRVADNVANIWREHKEKKGTQIVFLDLGTPGIVERAAKPRTVINMETGEKSKRPPTEEERLRGLDMYDDLRKKLLAQGIPADQIYFMQDVKKGPKDGEAERRRQISRKVRRGEIRVLIGSTESMGTGMNVQDRLVALHNVDPPIKPSDLEQRNGRILRRGNKFFEADPTFRVRILNYATSGRDLRFGFDAYMWQIVQRKAKILAAFYAGDLALFDKETKLALHDTMLNASHLKAVSTGNPLVTELNDAQLEYERLRLLQRGFNEQRREAGWAIETLRQQIPALQAEADRYRKTGEASTPHKDGETLTAEIKGEPVETHKAIGTAIINEAMAVTTPTDSSPANWAQFDEPVMIGTFRGLVMRIEGNGTTRPHVSLRHPEDRARRFGMTESTHPFQVVQVPMLTASKDPQAPGGLEWRDPVGLVTTLSNQVDLLSKPGFIESKLEEAVKRVGQYEAILSKPFPEAAQLAAAEANVERLELILKPPPRPGEAPAEPRPTVDVGTGQDEDDDSEASYYDIVGSAGGGPPISPRPSSGPTFIERATRAETGTPLPPTGPPTGGGGPPPLLPSSPAPTGPPTPPGPSGMTGGTKLYPFPFTELVQLVKDIGSNLSVKKRFRKVGKRGQFSGPGGIHLAAFLFKTGNEKDLARVLSHEIGHLIDWLPHNTLKRGNLLGRLYSLQNYVKSTFTDPTGADIANEAIRQELMELSAAWRPWPKGNAALDRYRSSPKELYADAISVLLQDPDLLEKDAPLFYKQFFLGLDQKPEVSNNYFRLTAELAGTPEELSDRRIERVLTGQKAANLKRIDAEKLRRNSKRYSFNDLWAKLRIEFVDVNSKVNDMVRALQQRGILINPDDDPRTYLQEREYLGGKQKAFATLHFEPIYRDMKRAGIDWGLFGAALMYERVFAGDRPEILNPYGYDPSSAKQDYDRLMDNLTPEQRAELKNGLAAFHHAVRLIAGQAHDNGLYSDEKYADMLKNPAYATFLVLDHVADKLDFKLYNQIGTASVVLNPADATMHKVNATIRAIERQKMLNATFTLMDTHYPGTIEQAKETWTGKRMEPVPPPQGATLQGTKLEMVWYYEKGKARAKYVPPMIADSLLRRSIGHDWTVVEGLNFVHGNWYKPMYTTLNFAFQIVNVRRDFMRFYKNVPQMTYARAFKRYWQAVPMARIKAFGVPDVITSPAQLQAMMDLFESEQAGIFTISLSELNEGRETSDTVAEEMFASLGLMGYDVPKARTRGQGPVRDTASALAHAWAPIYQWFKDVSTFFETIPKAAAIIEYKGKGPVSAIPADVRTHIREAVGSPDFLKGGKLKPVSNAAFLFSNAIIQAVAADMRIAFGSRTGLRPGVQPSRGEWWWKTVQANVVPKLVQAAFIYGPTLFLSGLAGGGAGDDKEKQSEWADTLRWIKDMLEGATEYDLTNYIVIPFGIDEFGRTRYLRWPQDDTGRMIGGITWKAIQRAMPMAMRALGKDPSKLGQADENLLTTLGHILDYSAGQLPSVAPVFRLAKGTWDFVGGRNVYDPFRQQYLFTDTEMQAADRGAQLEKFLKYQFQQMGTGAIWKFATGPEAEATQRTPLQNVVEFPLVLGNIAGRFIRVTDYGHTQRLLGTAAVVAQGEAREQLAEQGRVRLGIRELQKLPPPQRRESTAKLARQIADELYAKEDAGERNRQRRDIEKKLRMGVVRGNADALTEAVMRARTLDQKAAVIRSQGERMTDPAFNAWIDLAAREDVISSNLRDRVRKERKQPAAATR